MKGPWPSGLKAKLSGPTPPIFSINGTTSCGQVSPTWNGVWVFGWVNQANTTTTTAVAAAAKYPRGFIMAAGAERERGEERRNTTK